MRAGHHPGTEEGEMPVNEAPDEACADWPGEYEPLRLAWPLTTEPDSA